MTAETEATTKTIQPGIKVFGQTRLCTVMPDIKGKKVLVIGGAGFVGSHLCEILVSLGADVQVMDIWERMPWRSGETCDKKSFWERTRQIEGVCYRWGDVANERQTRDALEGVEVVFNLAARVAGVQWNQANNSAAFHYNYLTQYTPMRLAVSMGVERYLSASSVCVYGPDANNPAVEYDIGGAPVTANEGYSYAKRMGENLAMWFQEEQGLSVIRVRPSNIYGPRDYFDAKDKLHVIPALIKKIYDTPPDGLIEVNGSGKERREFLYVTDAAWGMVKCAFLGDIGQVYNLGTDGHTSCTIHSLADELIDICGTCQDVQFTYSFDPGDAERWSDARLAKMHTGWQHTVSLRDGLKSTVEFFEDYHWAGE